MDEGILIMFSGAPTEESVKYLTNFGRKYYILLLTVFVVSMIALAISVSMLTEAQTAIMTAVYVITAIVTGVIVLYGFIVLFLLNYLLNTLDLPFYNACYFENQRITIDEWGIENRAIYDPSIKTEIPPAKIFIKYIAVKKVVETEDFYIIVAGRLYKKAVVCQKNLLKHGTLKDFEEIFKGKIKQAK